MKTILFLIIAAHLFAEDVNVTLAWTPSPEVDIAYYNLKIGTASGVYTQVVQITGAAERTIPLLKDTMFFAVVTAVNTSALESPPSAQLVFQAFKPGEGRAPSAPVGLGKPAALQASLEMSKDLKVWATVFSKDYTVTEPAAFWRVSIASQK